MKFIYSLTLLAFCLNLFSQRGKDGVPTIGAANTIVNVYTPVTNNIIAGAGSSTINVVSSTGFAVGDLIMIIQMQGTSINAYHGGTTGPFFDSNSAFPTDTTFGRITNYNNCGLNEFAQISSIPDGTSIVVDCDLKNSYDVSRTVAIPSGNVTLLGRVQVIRVPRYASLTLNGTGSISCPQWNGTTGGVAVVEVENNTILNSVGAFNVSGRGFRGGAVFNYTPTAIISSDKYGANRSQEGGGKGESVAGDSAMYRNYASVFSRGNMANGGGGGNSHNSGGGGGANGHNGVPFNSLGNPATGFNAIWNLEFAGMATNASSGGGRGGYSFSNSNQNVSTVAPGTFSTPSNPWGGDKRRAVGGFGGRPLNYVNGRLFLGGGGGAGQGNDGRASAGANGGGLAYLICYGNVSGSGTILANGANASNSGAGCSANDGAGGGGGGGAIVLNVNGTINLTAGTALSAVGGNGGNVNFNCAFPNNTAYGPGAGGGGGYIASTGTLPSNTIAGGNNGTVTGNSNNIGNNFPPNGATRGGSGGSGSVNAYTLTPSASQTLCTNQAFTVTATSTEPGVSINWYNTLVGGSAIATGTAYASSGYTTAGTYTLFAGACSGTYRQPIELTVTAGLNMTVNSPTICPNQTVTLTASGATTYTWNTGPTTSTINVSPSSTTIYTINGTSGLCSGTRTTVVTVSSQPTIAVASTSICSGNSTTLTATGASNYTWNPGGQTTTSIVVSPTITTTYSITGSNGACTNSTTASVNVTTTPTLTANSNTVCPNQVATFTATGATNYTWSPGNISGTTFTISPSLTTTVAVIGANGICTSQITRTVTVSPSPTIAVSNQTICPTQTVTLTASGASTYTWNTGPTTSTISVSPSSQTIYTVTGSLGNCTSVQTATVSVASQPTITVTSASICSGNSATLTANGATSYTWASGGQTTSSVVVTPSVNTTYTITGSNGVCSSSTTANVNVTATPTLAVSSVTICPTQTATLNVSGASSYTWSPGNINSSSYTIAPASNTVVTVIGASGNCSASTTASVTIGTGISITVNNATICAGQTASLVASGASSYTWSSGANTNTLNVNPTTTTVYTISGTSGACSGINTATVNVVSQPTISVSSVSICSGSSATLTASGASNYTWNPSAQTSASITDSPNSTTIYTITGTNGVCTNTTTATINVTTTPTVAVSSVTICTAQTATLTASGATNYTWTPGNSIGNTFTLSPISNTVVTVIGANGTCTSQSTASITIGSSISITVNSATICAGETASLTASGTTSYTWDSGANTNTLNVTPSVTTIYTVTGSNGSCNGSNTSTVTVNSIPTLTVNNANICSGQTATLSVTGANTYTWSNGVNGNSISISPTTTTVFTVTGTSANGCVNSSITTTTVNVTATPTISINSTSICAGQTATLTATGATNYTWSTSANTASIVDNPNTTTSYSVSGDNGGCSASATTTILVTPSPTITASSTLLGGCAPFCTNFTDNVSASATGIIYNFGDGNTANSNNPNHCYTNGGSYTVTATVTNSVLGCSSTFTLPIINVVAQAVADFNISQGNTVTVGAGVNFINTSTNATNYIWSVNCSGQTATSTDLNTLFADTGSCCINLVASQPSGCSDTVTKCIDIINQAVVVIPNVFTPNGDGKNDVFKVKSNGLKSLNCVIYDRWGLKMYEWDGINGSWDGNARTGIAPDGTYYYIINYTDQLDKTITEKGYLNLFN
jgi:gliding motility-associated-like protein